MITSIRWREVETQHGLTWSEPARSVIPLRVLCVDFVLLDRSVILGVSHRIWRFVMMLRSRFEELEAQLKMTTDRHEQDMLLDQWLDLRQVVLVESNLIRNHDPDLLGRRSRLAFEPIPTRRVKFLM